MGRGGTRLAWRRGGGAEWQGREVRTLGGARRNAEQEEERNRDSRNTAMNRTKEALRRLQFQNNSPERNRRGGVSGRPSEKGMHGLKRCTVRPLFLCKCEEGMTPRCKPTHRGRRRSGKDKERARDLIVRLCGFPGLRSNLMEIPVAPRSLAFYKGSQAQPASAGRPPKEMREMRSQPLTPYPILSRTPVP